MKPCRSRRCRYISANSQRIVVPMPISGTTMSSISRSSTLQKFTSPSRPSQQLCWQMPKSSARSSLSRLTQIIPSLQPWSNSVSVRWLPPSLLSATSMLRQPTERSSSTFLVRPSFDSISSHTLTLPCRKRAPSHRIGVEQTYRCHTAGGYCCSDYDHRKCY
jgi:hypothetical protein